MTQLADALQALGMEEGVVDLWDAFLTEALDLLGAARDQLFDQPQWQKFIDRRDDPDAKSGTGTFGTRRRKGLLAGHRVPDEVALSQEMLAEMTKLYGDEGERWPVLHRHRVQLRTNDPALHGNARGKSAKLVDLVILAPKPGSPSFAIETKVLINPRDVRFGLLGREGLDCFTRKNPYTLDRVGGLLAYTVREDHVYWLDLIRTGYDAMSARCASSMPVQIGPGGPAVHLAKVERPSLTNKHGQPLGPIIVVNAVATFDTFPPAI